MSSPPTSSEAVRQLFFDSLLILFIINWLFKINWSLIWVDLFELKAREDEKDKSRTKN